MKTTSLIQLLKIKHPIIMAPMFLVTNTQMMIDALNSGIAACIPVLNFRTIKEFEKAINEIRNKSNSTGLGANLIVNKSNTCYYYLYNYNLNNITINNVLLDF